MRSLSDVFVDYGISCGLIEPDDRTYIQNRIIELIGDNLVERETTFEPGSTELVQILDAFCDESIKRGFLGDSITERDLFDTKLMGLLTPFPHEVRRKFKELYLQSPKLATDWFYKFSGDTNYIRRDRIAKDKKWQYDSKYGKIDITINLSKPEKDPKAIAAAKYEAAVAYPKCQLCAENEGYAGRLDHPARQNHRLIPVKISESDWFLQYSPYVYYNEHCIVLSSRHEPMKIERETFRKLFDFVIQFPHYFVGSNADLPIVGGSILSHDHFQGGRYEFAMERAGIEKNIIFEGFEDVKAGIVKWPLSVIRLRGSDDKKLVELSSKILDKWRSYSDEKADILAYTDNTPHNTITPIARTREGEFEIDLVLRNNRTTDERPYGLFHPHEGLHHIKKENIGLIEVMGLAVLPPRLEAELAGIEQALLRGDDLRDIPEIEKHADWLEEIKTRRSFSPENVMDILREEVGAVFEQVLECAGVFKQCDSGIEAFMRFIDYVNKAH